MQDFDSAPREPCLSVSSVCLNKEQELMFVVGCLVLFFYFRVGEDKIFQGFFLPLQRRKV